MALITTSHVGLLASLGHYGRIYDCVLNLTGGILVDVVIEGTKFISMNMVVAFHDADDSLNIYDPNAPWLELDTSAWNISNSVHLPAGQGNPPKQHLLPIVLYVSRLRLRHQLQPRAIFCGVNRRRDPLTYNDCARRRNRSIRYVPLPLDRNSLVFPKVTAAIQLKVASIAAPISILMREHLPHISAGLCGWRSSIPHRQHYPATVQWSSMQNNA
ncbi:hypothetical protein F5146DRAFT_1116710 [Armillaria mellea]|nr:hypothetical protein F5146DRAFT_1116710 [Armillaria mellea]